MDVNPSNVSPVHASLVGPVGTQINSCDHEELEEQADRPRGRLVGVAETVATVSQEGVVTSVGKGTDRGQNR